MVETISKKPWLPLRGETEKDWFFKNQESYYILYFNDMKSVSFYKRINKLFVCF